MKYQRHTVQEKQEAVRLHMEGGDTYYVAARLGKGVSVVTSWLRASGVLRTRREAGRLRLISKITAS